MGVKSPVADLLATKPSIILDGALATELEARNLDLSSALWSAAILRDSPDAIYQVHLDYFRAGADVAITASYQATPQGMQQHLGLSADRSRELIKRSVELAQRARDTVLEEEQSTSGKPRTLLVAGSVGPYGAYLSNGSEYRGDYSLPNAETRAFHRARIQTLVDSGVDLLALETMPSFSEISSLLELLEEEFTTITAWVSCTLRDAEHLSDGTPMADVAAACNNSPQVSALGVNCIPEQSTLAALEHLKTLTKKPLLAYPNSGEEWDAEKRAWRGERAQGRTLAQVVTEWSQKGGARLIGGCCRTKPADTEVIKDVLP
ncbi:hypothetical protein H2203_004567 [Taxawa tesnikishii (nom. ined.)]|nr:hypothetical protein H2203_004567 [Dothideales sp. JES 119]